MISDKLKAQSQGDKLLKEALGKLDRDLSSKYTQSKKQHGQTIEKYLKLKTDQFKKKQLLQRPKTQTPGMVSSSATYRAQKTAAVTPGSNPMEGPLFKRNNMTIGYSSF